jgi:hypothetical protein
VKEINNCAIDGTYDYTPTAAGKVKLCAVAFDRLQRKSVPQYVDLTVDRSPPAFGGFRIADASDGATIHSMPPSGIVANVEVTITDDSLNVNSVAADFSKLTGSSLDANRGPNDVGTAPTRTITWYNVPITRVTPCEFSVKATDLLGNTGSRLYTCDIVEDTSPPEVLGETTGFTSEDGTIRLGVQGTLTVRFKEAGMSRANAYLDTRGLGMGIKKAESCEQVSGNWECAWHLPANAPVNRYELSVTTQTTDDLGNALANEAHFNIDYDPSPPTIISGPSIKVFHQDNDYGDQIVRGDTVELAYNVTDAFSAIINASATGAGVVPGVCDETGLCTFAFTIEHSGSYHSALPVRFVDDSGNHADTAYNLTVHGILNETHPNYWTSTVTCSPDKIDRSTTTLVNHQIYCRAHLTATDNSASTVSATLGPLDQCNGTNISNSISDISIVNGGYKSRDPYMRVLLATREYPEVGLNLTCPMYILTQVGDGFTSYPEQENVTMHIEFGDSNLGTLSQAVDSKINSAQKDVDDLNKWLDTAVKVLQFGDKVCQVRTLLWDVLGVLEIVNVALDVASKGWPALEPTRQAWCQGKSVYTTGLAASYKGIDEAVLRPICNFINCNNFFGADINLLSSVANVGTQKSTEPGQESNPPVVNVRESIIWSVATLCLPGIVYNIDKYRQIQCQYTTCLKRDVKKLGVPVSVCDDQKSYMTCVLIWTQIFYTIPYANLINSALELVKSAISDPFVALTLVVSNVCPRLCNIAFANAACSVLKVAELIGRAIGDVQQISKTKNYFKLGQGPCQELKDFNKGEQK